jgi:acyl-CoA reductase-like NAD-dependent aldehyde dehydrogenase
VNILFGSGAVVGEAIVKHPDVPLISFTGSTGVGARIMGQVKSQICHNILKNRLIFTKITFLNKNY